MPFRLPVALLLLFASVSCFAQVSVKQRKLDSLVAIIKKNERDTNHVKSLLEYIKVSRSASQDTAMLFAEQAIEIVRQKGYSKFLGRAYNSLAVVYVKKGLVDTGLVLYDTAIAAAVRAGDFKTASLASNGAGYQLYMMVDYSKALDYYLDGYDYAQKSEDVFAILNSLNNISSVYFAMRNYDMAKEYTWKMIDEAKSRNDKSTEASSYGNLGALHAKQDNLDSAIYYANAAIAIFKEMGAKSGYANFYVNCGNYLFKSGRYAEAREMSVNGLAMSESGSDLGVLSRALTLQAQLELLDKNSDSALVHAVRARDVAKKSNSVEQMLAAMEVIAQVYLSTNRNEDARALYSRIIALQDSFYDENAAKTISEMQIRFDTRRTKEENVLLSKENEINAEKIRTGNILLFAGAIATFLILVVLVLVYRGFKQKQRSASVLEQRNKLISTQRDLITVRNKEITDSINYAKRIQEAILPSIDEFVRAAGTAFVYFRPKDIVSGDFYWHCKMDNHVLFAVADCTGHGVPGGFMSVLGIERLADFAEESSVPGEVLGKLNLAIKRSLHQEEEGSETRDGMDIALCSFNRAAMKLHYAGANRPLWIVRNGILIETTPTKAAIGGLTPDNQKFTTHTIGLEKNDMIFLATDGYADQFGGESGKKFMTRKLKDLLVQISSEDISTQQVKIESSFMTWRGKSEQVDDVLVIGIRV
jgi:serine phosphatase RsbU (regulator of sigma subunit)